ncbi:7-cyano-7-deazaguanine synthase QueC, partial [Staphylococcus cohnii]
MTQQSLNSNKAIVVFSGGQDSTTCLFWAKQHYDDVELVTFEYGQRHDTEIKVAKQIAETQNVKHHILDQTLIH